MKIFIGPHEIAGIASSLKKGFDEIGVESESILSSSHIFKYSQSKSKNKIINIWQFLGDKKINLYRKNLIGYLIFYVAHRLLSFLVFFWSIIKFDVYLFIFGETITNTKLELIILKYLKKKIIFIYLGSDGRPPYVDGKYYRDEISFRKILRRTKMIKKRVRNNEKFADHIINSPFTSQFHTVKLINWFSIGFAKKIFYQEENKYGSKTRILHAPSNSSFKGTDIIELIIKKLIIKGYEIDYVKIQGLPNAVVVDELKKCDFVVDQVFSDTPLAGLAAEAACFGKPSVVGGYAAEKIYDICHPEDIPPSVYVHPNKLEEKIEELIVDYEYRIQLGESALKFMKKNWSQEIVAKKVLRVINNDIPDEWLFNPYDINYIEGAGVSTDASKVMIFELISKYGIKSLHINDKPLLESEYLLYCNLSNENQ